VTFSFKPLLLFSTESTPQICSDDDDADDVIVLVKILKSNIIVTRIVSSEALEQVSLQTTYCTAAKIAIAKLN